MPMMTRMMPPSSSALILRAIPHPHFTPNISPITDRINETKPMMPTAGKMSMQLLIPIKAKETPTANASILVATAKPNTTFKLVGSYSCLLPSSLKDSIIMRPPKKANMIKAIQWSTLSIMWLKIRAPAHPSSGINAWKNPKQKAMNKIGRSCMRFRMIPLAMDTAKQSIASPTASSQISNPVIV